MARTIESPGVEIRERDLSLVASLPVGTNIFINGYAPQGPTDELINVTSISEFEAIFGTPTNAAERYFYHSCAQALQSPGNLLVTRLPYGSGSGAGFGTQYSALLYPFETLVSGNSAINKTLVQNASGYIIGRPTQITLTDEQYANWESGQINWTTTISTSASGIGQMPSITGVGSVGNAGIVIINELKTVVDDQYAGYYVAIADNTNIGDTTYDAVTSIKFEDPNTSNWSTLPTTRLEFQLTGTAINDSISEDLETIPSWDFESNLYNDSLIVGLFKLRPTTYGQLQNVSLTKILLESHTGSLDSTRKWTPDFGEESYFLGTRINDDSTYMKILVNPNIATNGGSWLGDDGLPSKSVTVSFKDAVAMGPYADPIISSNRQIGNIPQKLEKSLRIAENKEQIPIDIVCDSGLSTIWAAVTTVSGDGSTIYDDTLYINMASLENADTGSSSTLANDWGTIYNLYNVFVSETRRDCMFIADPLRNIFVQGENYKTIENPNKNFSSNILTPLKNLTGGTASNYACVYANWVKKYDNNTGSNVWLPFSAFAAKIMANVDANLYPWWAPAGLNNGLITDIVDIALKPTQKQRDLLYRNSLNPVVYFPGDGYAVWGQKTLQKKPSAFDRINVRRLFLTLEKATLSVLRYFVFEPNTNFTRTRVVNVLTPIFDIAKNNEGVYDYLIVCDERNNTPQTIDNNELIVDIYIKPVRAAEFILVNFIATRTDQDFNELI